MKPITETELQYVKKYVSDQDKPHVKKEGLKIQVDSSGKIPAFYMPDRGGYTRIVMKPDFFDLEEWKKA